MITWLPSYRTAQRELDDQRRRTDDLLEELNRIDSERRVLIEEIVEKSRPHSNPF